MIIRSINKVTLLDYPGKVASTLFLVGCNMKCSFCYNSDLINSSSDVFLSKKDVIDFLKEKTGKIDGVCITGGEPTINDDLVDFIKDIKKLGFLVKLDTNGTKPLVIEKLIKEKLIDYIAMDIKSSFNKYNEITNVVNNLEDIHESIEIIKSSNIDHEFRTTVINTHEIEELVEIAKMVSPSKYFLQEFKSDDKVINKSIKAHENGVLEDISKACNKYTKTNIRKK